MTDFIRQVLDVKKTEFGWQVSGYYAGQYIDAIGITENAAIHNAAEKIRERIQQAKSQCICRLMMRGYSIDRGTA